MFNDYNTQKAPIILKEYGRNIQLLTDYVHSIKDRELRNLSAKTLIELMKQINPSLKSGGEDSQKLWDDLIIMSDFEMDIDAPFPKPDKSVLFKKPQKVQYKTKKIKYKHYGLNLQLMADKAVMMEDDEEREAATIHIGKLMKGFASVWNRENLDDEVILQNIRELSNGVLDLDLNKVREQKLFEYVVRDKEPKPDNNHRGKRRRKRKKRN